MVHLLGLQYYNLIHISDKMHIIDMEFASPNVPHFDIAFLSEDINIGKLSADVSIISITFQ